METPDYETNAIYNSLADSGINIKPESAPPLAPTDVGTVTIDNATVDKDNKAITIDTNVPIPNTARSRHESLGDLPFDDMEVGHSFLYPVEHENDRRIRSLRVRASRENVKSGHTKRFAVLKDDDGYRVFRTQ